MNTKTVEEKMGEAIDAADVLASRVESLFYAAPEAHNYHYARITEAFNEYRKARQSLNEDN